MKLSMLVKRGHSKIWREILVRDNDMLDTCSDCGASDLVDNGTLDTPGGKVGALNKISDVRHLLGMQVHQIWKIWYVPDHGMSDICTGMQLLHRYAFGLVMRGT